MEQILHLLSEYGLWIVFFGMIVEGTTVILLSGVLCHMGVLPCEKTILVAIAGAAAGDQLWYLAGKNYAGRVLSFFPDIRTRIEKVADSVESKADWMAMTSRFIYSGAVVFPIVLALHDYPHKRFTVFDTVGVSLASITGISIGYFLSDSYNEIMGDIKHIEILFLLIIFWVVSLKLYRSRKKAAE